MIEVSHWLSFGTGLRSHKKKQKFKENYFIRNKYLFGQYTADRSLLIFSWLVSTIHSHFAHHRCLNLGFSEIKVPLELQF